ncbi:glutamate decarboxylase [Nocardioides panaciterrulae]|uniref:Glutamate decarboxylase n=1 Tax=Nocardioides panaciterrulae TaxID=661492 RepID=A0A7Y9E9A8_9ACTN|nr:glutamate decarboxylase [Nocardioides panaciterrulae]NYD43261.1 glutamate decarboxylase [Nocardioides panaciterrulae]
MAVWRRHAEDEAAEAGDAEVLPRFTRAGMLQVPTRRLGEREMLPQTAYQIVMDEVMLDGNARFNLATFVTTWMDEEADRLYAATAEKNMVDKDEYPQTAAIEERCVRMIGELWHAPHAEASVGTSTTGSSEGCMLAGLAMKRRWQHARRAASRPTDRPNLVMGANVQVVWEKFANYWEVEPRYVPLEGDVLHLTADRLLDHVDENTIGVVAVLGSTMDGSYEPVAEICAALDRYEAASGVSVPVHVDAASGGFVAPFLQPELEWDFRLPRVVSIQASGHKYGLVYPGVGWVVWRDAAHLPDDLVFHVNYLGGDMPTFALNFSRPGAQVVLQYFQFLRLGREGYRLVQRTCQDVAGHLARAMAARPEIVLVSDGSDLPVVTFALAPTVSKFDVYDVSRKLREHGWLVPAYTMPPNRQDLAVLRVVVRNGFSHDMAELFLRDLLESLEWLDDLVAPMPHEEQPSSFHH